MMQSIMKTALAYILRSLDYLIWAGFFALITYSYWLMSNGHMLIAYTQNVIGISIALIVDKIIRTRIYKKIEACPDDESRSKLAKKNVTSLKTSLYLFYIFALIFSQILVLETGIEVSENIRGYFQSVSYGVVLLFAIDNFFVYLISDDKRVKQFKKKYIK